MAKSQRGFASMDEERQRQIASKGGQAAHKKGTAHEFSTDEARAAGRKGGQAVSRNRDHMAEIGRKGGEAVSRNRDHMSEIGREGGHNGNAMASPENDDAEGARESRPDLKVQAKTDAMSHHTTQHTTHDQISQHAG